MKFALLGFFVSLSFVFLHGQSLTGFEEGSGQDSSETTTTTATVADSTVHIGPFVVVDEPGVRRLCTCAEVQKCSFVHESEITKNECATQCSHHLVPIDNDTFSLTECFKDDFLSELQASDTCIRANIQDLCSNSITAKKVPYSNLGLLQFDYPPITNPLYRSNVFMVKAEVVYTAIRTYQHCFSNCYRQKEAECRQHLNCAAKYPNESELESTLEECPDYRQTAFNNARIACKCMVSRKNIIKLVSLCSLFLDTIMAKV